MIHVLGGGVAGRVKSSGLKAGWFWPAASALALAALLASIHPATESRRLTNLDVARTGFPDTYIMYSKSEAGRCFVVDRRDSTMRRSDPNVPGRKWDCSRFPLSAEAGRPEAWFVRSKRLGKGTMLFVPVEEVRDWTYPFLYGYVRERHPELDLPALGWTQLFVNRIYAGLYLRVALPFDARKKDGGSGILREIVTVRGNRLSKVDTRFDEAQRLYVDSVAESRFPELREPPALLAWLALRCPSDGTALLMSNHPPNQMSLLPLPVSLPRLYEALRGQPLREFEDRRVGRWIHGPWRATVGEAPPVSGVELENLRAGFENYAHSFTGALRTHAEFHLTLAGVRGQLASRQASVAGLGLTLREM